MKFGLGADYYRKQAEDAAKELERTTKDNPATQNLIYRYGYAYGRLATQLKWCINELAAAELSLEAPHQKNRAWCRFQENHDGECIERDLDAEIAAGKWGDA